MTIAICVFCGVEKFGAWVPCVGCGTAPTTLLERAKSVTLSDHNLTMGQLRQYSQAISAGKELPYDLLSMTAIAEDIFEADYYFEHENQADVLPCMHCKSLFTPTADEVFCSACNLASRPLAACHRCNSIYDQSARYCQGCGEATSTDIKITPRSLARTLGRCVRQVAGSAPLSQSNFLATFRKTLSADSLRESELELEILALYTGMLVIAKLVPQGSIQATVRSEALALFRGSFVLQGLSLEETDMLVNKYLERLHEYDAAVAREPERWMFWLAERAIGNCFRVQKHIGTVTDMVVVIGYFIKILTCDMETAIS